MGLNLDKLHVDFEPPLYKKPKRGTRKAVLLDDRGTQLGGINVHYPKGSTERIEIPEALTVLNRPEYGEEKFPLRELDREALRNLVRDKLRARLEPAHSPQLDEPGKSVELLSKAQAARTGRRN